MNYKDDPIPTNDFQDTAEATSETEIADKEEVIRAVIECYNNERNIRARLSFFALGRIRKYFYKDTIGDLTSDDVVHIVLEKIISCRRKWDKNRFPNILDFIRLSILSFVRNEKKRKEKLDIIDLCDENGDLEEWKYDTYIRACFEKDFIEGILDAGKEQKLCDQLFSVLKEDVFATFVLEKRLEGMKSNIEIGKSLGIDVKEVENALKRIKRKYKEVNDRLNE